MEMQMEIQILMTALLRLFLLIPTNTTTAAAALYDVVHHFWTQKLTTARYQSSVQTNVEGYYSSDGREVYINFASKVQKPKSRRYKE